MKIGKWIVDGGGGDYTRNPNVSLYKNGLLMVYGIDWFIDTSNAEKMWNQIRVVAFGSVVAGDKLTLVRSM